MAGLVPVEVLADKRHMQRLASAARAAASYVVDYALPPRCAGCGAVTVQNHSFCIACWNQLHFLGEPCCDTCALPFEYDAGPGAQCGRCMADPPKFERLRAAVAYGDIARQVALKLKYSGRPAVAETLAFFMARHVPALAAEAVLAPVPLHRWRIWKRGYNQSALIASALARRTGGRAELDLIHRVKATPPLRGLNPRQREEAVRGAFRVREGAREMIAGRDIILVDDVFTSGATANGCAKALKRAGAASVNILCWARVVREEAA